MFAENRGDVVLPAKMDAEKVRTPLVMERGSIGLGTMNSQAEFKDVKVTQGEKVLYASDFAKGVTEWRSGRGGQWSVQDGVYRQQGSDAMARATTGDANWADYTLSLKARKTGGQGFQVSFRARDFGTSLMLNVGGTPGVLASVDRMANGTRTRLTPAAAGEVETGRWYDVKIDVQGPRVQCFLDGKLVIDIPNVNGEIVLPMMESVVSRVERTGEIVVKVVNFASQPQKTSVRLDGAAGVSANGTETVLTSASVEDENTLDQPTKVAPVSRSVSGLGPQFTYTFAPNSLTILRLKTAPK